MESGVYMLPCSPQLRNSYQNSLLVTRTVILLQKFCRLKVIYYLHTTKIQICYKLMIAFMLYKLNECKKTENSHEEKLIIQPFPVTKLTIFYYMQFNSNPRTITFEFSVNGITKRRVVIIKKTSYISSMLEIA